MSLMSHSDIKDIVKSKINCTQIAISKDGSDMKIRIKIENDIQNDRKNSYITKKEKRII